MKTYVKYLITFVVGLILALWVMISKDLFAEERLYMIYQILAESFSVPAVLMLGFGGLVFVSNEGMFDSLSYGLTSFMDLFRKEKRNKFNTFYDYKESKKDRSMSFGYLLICGIVFVAIAIVFHLLYANNI
ncbi:MAG: DUF3899 domain-containing protein [Clostridia bacterium]|nr:DUF3899 domain-containing protein [Clostridia bacterium]